MSNNVATKNNVKVLSNLEWAQWRDARGFLRQSTGGPAQRITGAVGKVLRKVAYLRNGGTADDKDCPYCSPHDVDIYKQFLKVASAASRKAACSSIVKLVNLAYGAGTNPTKLGPDAPIVMGTYLASDTGGILKVVTKINEAAEEVGLADFTLTIDWAIPPNQQRQSSYVRPSGDVSDLI